MSHLLEFHPADNPHALVEASIWSDAGGGVKLVIPLTGDDCERRRIVAVRRGLVRATGTWAWFETDMPTPTGPPAPRPPRKRATRTKTRAPEWVNLELF